MYTCGEKPGIGTYICLSCGTRVVLNDSTDTLPPCPECKDCKFTKA